MLSPVISSSSSPSSSSSSPLTMPSCGSVISLTCTCLATAAAREGEGGGAFQRLPLDLLLLPRGHPCCVPGRGGAEELSLNVRRMAGLGWAEEGTKWTGTMGERGGLENRDAMYDLFLSISEVWLRDDSTPGGLTGRKEAGRPSKRRLNKQERGDKRRPHVVQRLDVWAGMDLLVVPPLAPYHESSFLSFLSSPPPLKSHPKKAPDKPRVPIRARGISDPRR
ncbi:hypothetical protein LY76DRAFT_346935 [Colletotrichum caudatum]|nr:hypothetical protein LY76DRAFT_346935 [Colletotrichum caudatum]